MLKMALQECTLLLNSAHLAIGLSVLPMYTVQLAMIVLDGQSLGGHEEISARPFAGMCTE